MPSYAISRVARKRPNAARPTAIILRFKAPPPAPRRRRNRKSAFRLDHIRRREIERFARHVDAADTEDLDQYLIAWVWHNRQSTDPIWAIRNAARRMGRPNLTVAEASAILGEASDTRKHLTADNLARFLGVTYAQRQALRLTTIGSIDVKKRARKELRKRRDRIARERKRRALGMRPQSESLSATKPWRELGMSRAAWYRRNKARRKGETTLSAALFICSEDRTVSTGLSEQRCRAEERIKKELSVFADGDHDAADRYVTAHSELPLELRLLALGLT